MQIKKPTKTYADLNDTITPLDYAEWRGIGENKAREIFNEMCENTKEYLTSYNL